MMDNHSGVQQIGEMTVHDGYSVYGQRRMVSDLLYLVSASVRSLPESEAREPTSATNMLQTYLTY